MRFKSLRTFFFQPKFAKVIISQQNMWSTSMVQLGSLITVYRILTKQWKTVWHLLMKRTSSLSGFPLLVVDGKLLSFCLGTTLLFEFTILCIVVQKQPLLGYLGTSRIFDPKFAVVIHNNFFLILSGKKSDFFLNWFLNQSNGNY